MTFVMSPANYYRWEASRFVKCFRADRGLFSIKVAEINRNSDVDGSARLTPEPNQPHGHKNERAGDLFPGPPAVPRKFNSPQTGN